MAKDNAVDVEAEVIEDEQSLSVDYVPASITANFDALEERVCAIVSDYEGAKYDLTSAQAIKEAKLHRSYLNGIAKQIDERRKAVKREYMLPYESFDKRARDIVSLITNVSGSIKSQLDEAEEARKAARYAELEEHYEDFAGLLAPVVPYERLHDPKWLNKTCAQRTAEAALDEKVSKLADDWETLKQTLSGSEFYDVAEREFFNTLDLGKAIAADARAKAEAQRIAELKAAMEPEPDPEPVHEPEPIEESVPDAEDAPVYWPVVDWVIEFSGTKPQAIEVADKLRSMGLTGRIHTTI